MPGHVRWGAKYLSCGLRRLNAHFLRLNIVPNHVISVLCLLTSPELRWFQHCPCLHTYSTDSATGFDLIMSEYCTAATSERGEDGQALRWNSSALSTALPIDETGVSACNMMLEL
jgi:hypothetical protein